jgi:two-component system response regulator AtoC
LGRRVVLAIKAEENIMAEVRGGVLEGPGHLDYGVSPALRALHRAIADVAVTDIPVLIVGESGTDKEAVALEIHRRSRQRNEPFLKFNCSVLTAESLATHLVPGKDGSHGQGGLKGGTMFLDEISQLNPANQNYLLHLLSDGDSVSQECYEGPRLISATTRRLENEVRAGRFREELYYRVNVFQLRLPALRDRKEDIPALLDFYMKKYASQLDRPMPSLGPVTMNRLLMHSWPGNVREVENFARKIIALGDEQLALSDLTASSAVLVNELAAPHDAGDVTVRTGTLKEVAREASREAERVLILTTLERTHWNRKRSARELQISYKALLYKLKQLGLDSARNSEHSPAKAQ